MVLTFHRGRFSLRGQQHSRSFYTHPSTPLLLSSCSWETVTEEKRVKGEARVKMRRGVIEDGQQETWKRKVSMWGKGQEGMEIKTERETEWDRFTLKSSLDSVCVWVYCSHLKRQKWTCVYFSMYCIYSHIFWWFNTVLRDHVTGVE